MLCDSSWSGVGAQLEGQLGRQTRRRGKDLRVFSCRKTVAPAFSQLDDKLASYQVRLQADMIKPGTKLGAWPLTNVWCGTSIEDQKRADERIPQLLAVRAHTRFLSIEPLLGEIVLLKSARKADLMPRKNRSGIHWAIVGGESGRKARPMHPAWARSLRDECLILAISFFFKQIGQWGWHDIGGKRRKIALMPDGRIVPVGTTGAIVLYNVGKKAAGEFLDGELWREFPNGYAAQIPKRGRASGKSDRREPPFGSAEPSLS